MTEQKSSKSKPENLEKQDKLELGFLEEDDEFEEFPTEDWGGDEEDNEDINVWENDWDDDNIDDDFTSLLRGELKNKHEQEPMKP